jgi:hypothetical protein
MNQDMIDRIVQSMNQNKPISEPSPVHPPTGGSSPSKPEPEKSVLKHAAGFESNKPTEAKPGNYPPINVSLRRKDGKNISGEVENLNFGGFIVRLTDDFPVNTPVTMNLSSGNSHINGLEGICTNCDKSEHQGHKEFVVAFCFGHLSRSHFEQLRSLITR